jgi:PAS domain S-box-containing protein
MHMLETFSKIIEHYVDAVCVLQPNTLDIIACNSKFNKLFENEQTGSHFFNVFDNKVSREKQEKIKKDIENLGIACCNFEKQNKQAQFTSFNFKNEPKILVRLVDLTVKDLHYQVLFEKNVAGVFKTYLDGTIIDCNQAFANIVGYASPDEVKKVNAKSFYPTSDNRGQFLDSLRQNGFVSNYKITLKNTNGELRECLENTFLDTEIDGKEIINGTIIDVSEQVRSEQALLESEQRFRVLSSVGHEGVIFVKNDKITDANDQFAALFEVRSSDEVIGKRIAEFFSPTDLKRIYHNIAISPNNHIEVRCYPREGKSLVFDISGAAINYRGAEVRVIVVNDITNRKKAELAIEQTALRFRNLLENLPNAVVIVIDEKIKYLNNAALDLLGVDDEDELYDLPFLPFIEEKFKEDIKQDLIEIREGGEIGYREIQLVNQAGAKVDVGLKSTLTIYENKPAIQISINNISERVQLVKEQMRIRIVEEINTVLKREIEEHKNTQLKLELQKSQNENLINSSLDMIIASDQNRKITQFNKAAQMQFGYTLKEINGLEGRVLYFDQNDFDRVDEILREKGQFFGEIQNIKRNGEVFTSLLSASLIRNEKGEIVGAMGVSRDITEYRANERKALEQKAKLESIFNSTENLMMWTMDRAHKATTVNENFVNWAKDVLGEEVRIGLPITEMLLRHVDENYYQDQLDSFNIALKGRHQQFEFPMLSKSGQTLWLQAFLNPVHFGDKPEEISCLVYDVTERKIIDRRIRDSLKEKEVLLQEVHHRVKNNLQVISSILNLQSGYVTDPGTLEILQESQQRIKSMSFIHETLYRTSDFNNINFSEYIKTLTYNLIQSYRLQSTTVELIPEIEDVSIQIDQAIPCGLMVNELVSNALKYAFKGRKKGKLYLSLKESADKVFIRIADDGVGLPPSFQHEKTDSLGIQLVYTLIEQLDGTIEVSSNQGTEFLITFEKRK